MYVLSLLLLAACLPSVRLIERKPLDDYVAQFDPHYNYTIQKKEHKRGVTIYMLNMTSLKWLDETEVDRSIWWHQLNIVVAKTLKLNYSCLLILSYGRNDNMPAFGDYNLNDAIKVARSTGSCVALLKQIPNQPITFHKIPMQQCKNAGEDFILGCSFWKFLYNKTAEPHTLVLFPMVKAFYTITMRRRREEAGGGPVKLFNKAAVRAMDTITECLRKDSGGKTNITKFTVAGISKRGWTAWVTAAVDERAPALFPLFFDLLNLVLNLKHQYRSYCGWSFALNFLYEMNVTRQLDNPRFKELVSLIDPFEFKERYAKKSMFISVATGDEFMQPDDSYYYYKKLPGDKYFRSSIALIFPILLGDDEVRVYSEPNLNLRNRLYDLDLEQVLNGCKDKELFDPAPHPVLIPNVGHVHTLIPGQKLILLGPLTTFYVSTMKNLPRPQVSWTRTETNTTGTISLYTDQVPSSVKCYHAHTWISGRRDFRLFVYAFLPQPVLWFPCRFKKLAKGVYKAEMEKPVKGWTGFFMEVTFSIPGTWKKFILTSEVQIIPNTYPCPECQGEQCYGKLV